MERKARSAIAITLSIFFALQTRIAAADDDGILDHPFKYGLAMPAIIAGGWALAHMHHTAPNSKSGTAGQSASNGNTGNPCPEIEQQIRDHIRGMEKKYDELLADQHSLYVNAKNPVSGVIYKYGTWSGHVIRYEGLRVGLFRMVQKAQSNGCSVPPGAQTWLNTPAPTAPK